MNTTADAPLVNRLCAFCSCSAGELCSRCAALVASGRNEGPLPPTEIARARAAKDCCLCNGRGRSQEDPRFCDFHRNAGARRRGPGGAGDAWSFAPSETPRHRLIESLWVK